jgi:hypothetical protein
MKLIPDLGPFDRIYLLAMVLLANWFGEPWVQKYIATDEAPTDFLRNKLNSAERAAVHTQRVVEMAEMILNFQDIGGWTTCMDQLAAGNIESGFSELDALKLCTMFHVEANFHLKGGKKGSDFDLDIGFPNGLRGAADVKCKLESHAFEFKASSIKATLSSARKQLPDNLPGVIFLKVPSEWMDSEAIRTEIDSTIETFMRGTRRIVCVEVYCAHIEMTEIDSVDSRRFTDSRGFMECVSRTHKFDLGLDWRLLSVWLDHGKPLLGPKWLRLWNVFQPLRGYAYEPARRPIAQTPLLK